MPTERHAVSNSIALDLAWVALRVIVISTLYTYRRLVNPDYFWLGRFVAGCGIRLDGAHYSRFSAIVLL